MKNFSKEELWSMIRDVPDFPKAGVVFKDIAPLLENAALTSLIDHISQDIEKLHFDAIACVESRGFLIGAPLAAKLAKPLYLIRKKGKLPPPVQQLSYKLEYGTDTLEMRKCSGQVLLIDDVLATGGTLNAAAELVEKSGGNIAATYVLINLKFLNSFTWNKQIPHALFEVL